MISISGYMSFIVGSAKRKTSERHAPQAAFGGKLSFVSKYCCASGSAR